MLLRIGVLLFAFSVCSTGAPAAGEVPMENMTVAGLQLTSEATLIRLSRHDQSKLQAALAAPASGGRVLLLLSGISARQATSIGFEVALLALDSSTEQVLDETTLATLYIFDPRPTRRSIDILPAAQKPALRAAQNRLAIRIRAEASGSDLSPAMREEIARAGISIDRIEIIIRS